MLVDSAHVTSNRRVDAIPPSPLQNMHRVREAMVRNECNRHSLPWGSTDLSRLTKRQRAAIHRIMSQLTAGEIAGRDISANLCRRMPHPELSDAFAAQILDESHHTAIFTRYVTQELRQPIEPPWLLVRYATAQLSRLGDPLIAALTASYFVEHTAAEVLSTLAARVDEPLCRALLRHVIRDEGRHTTLGREATLYLLDTPRYRHGWRRTRARVFRHFTELFLPIVFGQYAREAAAFDIDVRALCRKAIHTVHAVMP